MKRTLFFLVLGLLWAPTVTGQIKIGDNPQTIDPASVLELESGSRVLVVTRVSTAGMNAIVPLPGAVVYNTDLECLHYYNGSEWINICEEVGGIPNLTTDPYVNTRSTIVITTNGENNHIEVAPNSIRTEQIVDGGINGVDIQNNSIGQDKLANDAVSANELEENAVGVNALNNVEVEDYFTNVVGYITTADIVSEDGGNDLMMGLDGGAFYDEQPVLDAVQANTDGITVNAGAITTNANAISTNSTAISDHIADDGDLDDQNEILTSAIIDGNELVLTESGTETRVDLGTFNNTGSDNQDLSTNGNPGNISIDNGGTLNLNVNDGDFDATNEIQIAAEVDVATNPTNYTETATNVEGHLIGIDNAIGTIISNGGSDGVVTNIGTTGNNLNVTGINGGFNGNVDLEPLVDNAVSDNGYLTSEVDGSMTNEIITASTLTGNILTITEGGIDFDIDLTGLGGGGEIPDNELITNAELVGTDLIITDPGQTWTIPLASLGGGGADGVVTNVELQSGTDLVFTGTGGGFNGTIDLSNIDTTLDEATVDGFVANNGFLTAELDGDVTNEVITASSLSGTTLTITEGGIDFDIDLSGLGSGSLDLASVLTNGSSAGNSQINDLVDPTLPQDAATQNYVENRIATILATGGVDGVVSNAFLSGTEIDFIGSNGGFNGTVDLDPVFSTDIELASAIAASDAADGDTSNFNEIQTLSVSGDQLSISGTGGNTVTIPSGLADWTTMTNIPADFADDIDNTLDETAVDAFVANNGYLTAEVDGDTTN
ncbi:beta strand repeat-containing protein, partial [Maribacter polysaccharolyticus]|uniref:beta strand repeat-containing protein n=1 Tax=Maribacter polysaccharolyticus TaxID=3020831 RepID=UPI003B82D0ED|nr:hypothetical protein [Maribacter polysaccharolyticus]